MMFIVQATLLYFTSATAVTVFGVRLSDLALLLFVTSIVFMTSDYVCRNLVLPFIFIFILVSIVLSTINGVIIDSSKLEVGVSNAVAIPLGVGLALLLLFFLDRNWVLGFISRYSTTCVVICISFLTWDVLYGVPEWVVYEDEMPRFSAFSNNPNQLALYLLPVPFFSIISYVNTRKNLLVAIFDVLAAVVLNVFVIGKSLFIAWFFALIFLFLFDWVCFGGVKIVWIEVFAKVLFIGVFVFFGTPIVEALYHGNTPGSQDGQGDTRVQLWTHGLEAWLESPFLGHGPGHYSGLDAPFQNMEAHNFLIDWISAYGLIGGFMLIGLLAYLFYQALYHRAWIVFALYATLVVQSSFHFYGRQPIFWMLLVFGFIISSVDKNKYWVQR